MSKFGERLREAYKEALLEITLDELAEMTEDGEPLTVYLRPLVLKDRLEAEGEAFFDKQDRVASAAIIGFLVKNAVDKDGRKFFDEADQDAMFECVAYSKIHKLSQRVFTLVVNADYRAQDAARKNSEGAASSPMPSSSPKSSERPSAK